MYMLITYVYVDYFSECDDSYFSECDDNYVTKIAACGFNDSACGFPFLIYAFSYALKFQVNLAVVSLIYPISI